MEPRLNINTMMFYLITYIQFCGIYLSNSVMMMYYHCWTYYV